MVLSSVSTLLDTFGDAVWRADALADAASADGGVLPSGHALLDAQLPGGGWPVGALCEILQAPGDAAEWRLLLPALSALTRSVVLVGPSHLPFGPALAAQGLDLRRLIQVQAQTVPQRLWAAEQALRCTEVAALLVWLAQVRSDHLRRLHLAAQAHRSLLFVFRPASAQGESSPAVLRLLVGSAAAGATAGYASHLGQAEQVVPSSASDDQLAVQLLKRRGPPLDAVLKLPARHAALGALLAVHTQPNAGGVSGRAGQASSGAHGLAPAAALPSSYLVQPEHALDRSVAAA
jgi:protein ImuA